MLVNAKARTAGYGLWLCLPGQAAWAAGRNRLSFLVL